MARGAHAPSRAADGALADCFRSLDMKRRGRQDVVGGGADHDTRGACAPQTTAVSSLGEELGSAGLAATGPTPNIGKTNPGGGVGGGQ